MTSYKDVSAIQGWGPYDSRTREQHQRSVIPGGALDDLYFWVFDDDAEATEALALLPGDVSDSEVRAACEALGWRCVSVYREPLPTTKETDND